MASYIKVASGEEYLKIIELDHTRHSSRPESRRVLGLRVPQSFLPPIRQVHLWRLDGVTQRRNRKRTPAQAHVSTITLPVILQSHSVGILTTFHAPMIHKTGVGCNQWNKARTDSGLRRIWSRRWCQDIVRPKLLSLKVFCSDWSLLEALQQMAASEKLVLVLPRPSALRVKFFEALCAMSTYDTINRKDRGR